MKKKEDVQQKQGERLGDSDQFLIKISSDHSFTLANWCWSCVDVEHPANNTVNIIAMPIIIFFIVYLYQLLSAMKDKTYLCYPSSSCIQTPVSSLLPT